MGGWRRIGERWDGSSAVDGVVGGSWDGRGDYAGRPDPGGAVRLAARCGQRTLHGLPRTGVSRRRGRASSANRGSAGAAQPRVTVGLDLPTGVKLGQRTVRPRPARAADAVPRNRPGARSQGEWGHCDEAVALPGWRRSRRVPAIPPSGISAAGDGRSCRSSIGSRSRPRALSQVVLGLCESHWVQRNQRPLVCRVEGAPQQQVDPIAKLGPTQAPGVLLFKARDADGDGRLEIQVRSAPGASDRNAILNAIWIFPAESATGLGAGRRWRLECDRDSVCGRGGARRIRPGTGRTG